MFKKIFSLFLALLFVGCVKKGAPIKGRKEIIIIPKDNINNKMSLKIYIVQTYSEEAQNEISGMDSEEFFNKVKHVVLSFPDEVKVWDYDIVENSSLTCFVLPSKKKYYGLFVFFRFIQNVENKYMYPADLKTVEITLKESNFEVTNINRKFKYTIDKKKEALCIYLNPDTCIGLPTKNQNKTKKFN